MISLRDIQYGERHGPRCDADQITFAVQGVLIGEQHDGHANACQLSIILFGIYVFAWNLSVAFEYYITCTVVYNLPQSVPHSVSQLMET